MDFHEAYYNLKAIEDEQGLYMDQMLRKLEKIHNPPSVIVNFKHLVKVIEERTLINAGHHI